MGSDVAKRFGAKRDELMWFAPEQLTLVEDPQHPLYDERVKLPLVESLVLNIMAKGVIKPIVVKHAGETDKGVPIVEVVDGRQRVKHALEANRRLKKEGKEQLRVPGVRRRGDDADLFGVLVSANEFHQGDGVVTKARKLQRFLDLGKTKEEAAVIFGITGQTVRNYLQLLDCAPKVQRAIESGQLPATVVRDFVKLPRDKQEKTLAEMLKKGVNKGAAASTAARAVRQGRAVQDKAEVGKRVRSREFLLNWKTAADDANEKRLVAILGFVLGDDKALDGYAEYLKLAELAKA